MDAMRDEQANNSSPPLPGLTDKERRRRKSEHDDRRAFAEARAAGDRGELLWYIVRLVGRDHRLSRELLRRQGFPFYCPLVHEMRSIGQRQLTKAQRRDRNAGVKYTRWVERELFQNYFFVRFVLTHPRWHELFTLANVRGIVCAGGVPAAVPDPIIAKMQGCEVRGVIPASTTPRELFAVGEEVRISEGPFSGFNAKVAELPDKPLCDLDESARLGLLVDVFGRSSFVEMELGSVAKL
jgi:transcription antitermination factor NusG